MPSTDAISPSLRPLRRNLLRALNGAALGGVTGGALGYALGAVSAFVVDWIDAALYASISSTWSPQWSFCAAMGALPGVPAGLLLGTLIILRNDRWRLIIGAGWGLLVGLAYARLWFPSATGRSLVIGAIVSSGLAGGTMMALILTSIRRHWGWWTRWEEPLQNA